MGHMGNIICGIIDVLRCKHPEFSYRFDEHNIHLLVNRTNFCFYFEGTDIFVSRLKPIDKQTWEFCGIPFRVPLGDPNCFDEVVGYIIAQYMIVRKS